MHLHHFRCFEEYMRMLLQSLSALCKAPGGAGSIWEYLEEVVRATRVSGRFGYVFRTELHFADEVLLSTSRCSQPPCSVAKCSQTVQEHSHLLLKAPAVMEVH